MSLGILFGVVMLQVLTFQFAAVRLARRFPDYLVGDTDLPVAVVESVERFRQASGRVRYALGTLLLFSGTLTTWVLPLSQVGAKLTLAAISVISGAALAVGYVHDRIRLSVVAAELPEPTLRSASLRRPRLDCYYSPAWEMVPLLIFLATAVGTGWVVFGAAADGADSASTLFAIPVVQGLYVFSTLVYTLWNVRSGSRLSQSAKAFMGTPEQALEIEETLKGLNLRFFMVAKGMVALLLATMQADRIMLYAGHSVPVVVDLFHWGLVALLLVLFLTFLSQTSRLKVRT